ncbi:hypothetical protein A3715_37730, partial [Oleiphilus sp. HI0009]
MYKIQDLEKAKAELDLWEQKFANHRSNNPNKYEAQIKSARATVRMITESLKESGEIELTEHEKLERQLDQTFPNAKSNEVVEYNNTRYQRKFFPLERSRSRKSV